MRKNEYTNVNQTQMPFESIYNSISFGMEQVLKQKLLDIP